MRRYFVVPLLIVACSIGGLAQKPDLSGGFDDDQERPMQNKMADSLGYSTVKPEIKGWVLTSQFSRKDSILIDTLIEGLQNFNPIYQRSISNAWLGNLGAPYQSNIYMARKSELDFLFLQPYEVYLKRPDSKYLYFDTKTPFTRLLFATGGPRRRAENLLKVMHTQNISPGWNFAVNYNLISSDGQYQDQKTKVYDITFSSRYEKNRYEMYMLLNQNRLSVQENGGIVDDFFVRDTTVDAENIQVNLNDSRSRLTNFNFFMNHRYGVGASNTEIKGKDTLTSFPVQVVYTMQYEADRHKFEEDNINTDFYDNSFFSDETTLDKTEFTSLKNSLQVIFNENRNKWIRLGARFMLGNQMVKYTGRFNESTAVLGQIDKKFHNNFILANFYSLSGPKWNWNAEASYYFEGYRQNDINLSYKLTRWWNRDKHHGLTAFANLESLTPDFLFTEYNSNHHQWKNSFKATKDLSIGFRYIIRDWKFSLVGQVNQLMDYIYFNSNALPQQIGKKIRVSTIYVQKDFVLGNFHLSQKVIGQNTSSEKVIPLPKISVSSNNYYKNTFFKGALDIQTGFVVHYNSRFYAPGYMPSTGRFFVQTSKKLGDYPKVDIYFNFRINRTRFFFMYEHMNARIGSRNYFTTLHYPLNPAMLKYGLIWTFYN